MIKVYIGAVGQISRLFALIATALLISSMLVVCQMILLRYVFTWPTIWQTDYVIFSATAAIFLGAPYVLLVGGHVGVDVVEMMVGDVAKRRLRIVGSIFGLAFCAIMLAAGWIQFYDAWVGNWKHSSVWAPPLWVPLLTLPIGFGLLCLQYLAKILADLTGLEALYGTDAASHAQHDNPSHAATSEETMR